MSPLWRLISNLCSYSDKNNAGYVTRTLVIGLKYFLWEYSDFCQSRWLMRDTNSFSGGWSLPQHYTLRFMFFFNNAHLSAWVLEFQELRWKLHCFSFLSPWHFASLLWCMELYKLLKNKQICALHFFFSKYFAQETITLID